MSCEAKQLGRLGSEPTKHLCHPVNGIGLDSTMDSTSTVLLPNKLVTGAVTILNIYVDRDGEEPLVLYKNAFPNDLNNPSVQAVGNCA